MRTRMPRRHARGGVVVGDDLDDASRNRDGAAGRRLRAGGGYVGEIKVRNADEFISMASAAGAPDGVDRGVYVAGANYKTGDLSIGAANYCSDDIINIFYSEMKIALPLSDTVRLQLALQYSDQGSIGDNLLRGAEFSSHQWGGKVELGVGGALFSAAYTNAGGDTDMQQPWSSFPGYTSVQVEKFNRDGEQAYMLRGAYKFRSVNGLSAYGLWVNGSTPDAAGQYARDEYDFNIPAF